MLSRALLASAAFAAVTFVACLPPTDPCPQPAHPALTQQPAGQPCTASADCVSGLQCLAAWAVPSRDGFGGPNACATPCSGGCDGGTVCVPGQADAGRPDLCLPSCSSDTDCLHSTAAGSCSTSDGGADAGADAGAGYCQRITCELDSQCPSGFACEPSFVACCPAGAMCIIGGPQPGYCRAK